MTNLFDLNQTANAFYQKGEVLTLDEAKAKALAHFDAVLNTEVANLSPDTDEQWGNDVYFYGLSENYDLEIWTPKQGEYMIILYPLINGETDYNSWITVATKIL